jgi:hypothetical protein
MLAGYDKLSKYRESGCCWLLVAGYLLLVACCWMLVARFPMLALSKLAATK